MIRSYDNPMYDDCKRMLKNYFHLNFNFSKSELLQNEVLMKWITTMCEGDQTANARKACYMSEPFPERPLKSNVSKTFSKEQLSAVYLLNDDKIDSINNNGCMLFSKNGNEINTLSSLIGNDNYNFSKQIDIHHLKSWTDLEPYLLPCTDIIIEDRYIFSSEELYESNLYKLISQLSKFCKSTKLNIVFFAQQDAKKPYVVSEIGKRLKSIVCSQTKATPNITFVISNYKKDFHDRIIFTNYKTLFSGDSFNYFNSKNEVISEGDWICVNSLANIEYYQNAMNFIGNMQKIVDEVGRRSNTPNCGIIGDKISNYLRF